MRGLKGRKVQYGAFSRFNWPEQSEPSNWVLVGLGGVCLVGGLISLALVLCEVWR